MMAANKIIDTREAVRLVDRWGWLTTFIGAGYATVVVLTTILGVPYIFSLLTQTCEEDCQIYGQLTTTNARDLQAIGIGVQAYAIAYIIVLGIFTVICVGSAGLILWKKPGELLPFCAAYFILLLPSDTGQLLFFNVLFNDYPVLGAIYRLFSLPSLIIGYYLILTFPNGKFKGNIYFWSFIGLLIIFAATFVYGQLSSPESSTSNSVFSLAVSIPFAFVVLVALFYREKNFSLLNLAKYLGFILLCVASVVFDIGLVAVITYILMLHRYNTVLTPRERNYTKWLIFSFFILIFVLTVVLGILWGLPALTAPGTYYFLFFNFVAFFGCAITEIGLLLGVLYANAFDINLVIKRTIVYTALTVLVVSIYIGSVIGLQWLVRAVSGQQSDMAIVGATLVAVVLFQPLRQAIQGFVDKRFFRSRYNASRIIATFGASLQQETDLTQLQRQIADTVTHTMQPAEIFIWINRSATARKP